MCEQFLAELEKFEANCKSCKKIFCTTCGGLSDAAKRNMTDELNNEIKLTLSKISLESFVSLGEWSEFLHLYYHNEVNLILEREGKNIDISNISELDNYLLKARYFGKPLSSYEKLLKLGIQLAMESRNESLLETVAIVLGKRILNHEQLFNLVMQKSKTNKNIHRVLYNNLRQEIPEVRGFVGDGDSVYYW